MTKISNAKVNIDGIYVVSFFQLRGLTGRSINR